MDWKWLLIIFHNILILQNVFCQVYWQTAPGVAIFGQDIVLTCYLEKISTNAKDCPVRQWVGGPKRGGLVSNGYSSDINKYEEHGNLESFKFSLIVKQFDESDINVNYTCSCGFHASTKKLSLDEITFHYPPAGYNVRFSLQKHLLRVNLYISKVYPVPKCFLYLGDRRISGKNIYVRLKVTPYNNGLFYRFSYEAIYALKNDDCNKKQNVYCTFNRGVKPVVFKGRENFKCTGDNGYTTPTPLESGDNGYTTPTPLESFILKHYFISSIAFLVFLFVLLPCCVYILICVFVSVFVIVYDLFYKFMGYIFAPSENIL